MQCNNSVFYLSQFYQYINIKNLYITTIKVSMKGVQIKFSMTSQVILFTLDFYAWQLTCMVPVSLSVGGQKENRPETDFSFDKTFTYTRENSTAKNRKAWRVTMATVSQDTGPETGSKSRILVISLQYPRQLLHDRNIELIILLI